MQCVHHLQCHHAVVMVQVALMSHHHPMQSEPCIVRAGLVVIIMWVIIVVIDTGTNIENTYLSLVQCCRLLCVVHSQYASGSCLHVVVNPRGGKWYSEGLWCRSSVEGHKWDEGWGPRNPCVPSLQTPLMLPDLPLQILAHLSLLDLVDFPQLDHPPHDN